MRIIPAIDVMEGKCVRLSQGDYERKKVYDENPVDVAKAFEDAGFEYLHLVDLDGARSNHIVNYKALEKISGKTRLKIDFGGGIKSRNDVRIAFECGANQVTVGSAAVTERKSFLEWLNEYGSERIILAADAKREQIAISGWQEETETDVVRFISDYVKEGVKYVICTDIEKDGMLQGPAFELYEKILKKSPDVKLVASGGIASLKDLEILIERKLEGAIIGKAIYEGKIKLTDLQVFI
ncbi:MAG TPA: 1-(5-phosphoribosyl)-5-[(5-phosphoribosylamino)methylideneamino]imidazole-4-carboxamide isomerase [Chitinophagales bacterium]|nr:1-(5-phosphoribosyl)-5-[(5-phosphoribosylamino)methylideneamino]imidazole-4-carboxamide isomerase [Chitinophagales bacterium]